MSEMGTDPENAVRSRMARRRELPSLYADIMGRISSAQDSPDGAALAEINRMVDRFFSISTEMLGSESLTSKELERLDRFHTDIESGLRRSGVGGPRAKRLSSSRGRIRAMHAAAKSKQRGGGQQRTEKREQEGVSDAFGKHHGAPYTEWPQYLQIDAMAERGRQLRETIDRIGGLFGERRFNREVDRALSAIYNYCMREVRPGERVKKAERIADFESYLGENRLYHMLAIYASDNVGLLVSDPVMDFARRIGPEAAGGYFLAIRGRKTAERLADASIVRNKDVVRSANGLGKKAAKSYFIEMDKRAKREAEKHG